LPETAPNGATFEMTPTCRRWFVDRIARQKKSCRVNEGRGHGWSSVIPLVGNVVETLIARIWKVAANEHHN
jgi:hypothetical protein